MNGRTELFYLSIDEAAGLIERRELSPVELTRAYLDRIEATDHRLHSYIEVLSESATSQARAAEQAIHSGGYRGSLHGIPIALKDLYDTAGVRTTGSSKIYKDRIPAEDATTTARLREAGCVLLGKLAMSELAMTGPPGFGEDVCNAWNPDHVPGTSSSGSAVAVAAGLCAGSLGSDTGGSIRFPASHNNIVGLMPTYGRVSRYGVMPLSWTLDHAGPLTRTVEDAALMLGAIAGHDPKDRTSSSAAVPDYRNGLVADVRGLTIGVMREAVQNASDETRAVVEPAIAELESLGARTEDIEVPDLEHAHIANTIIYLAEGFQIYQEILRTQSQDIGKVFRIYGYMGGLLTGADYVQAQRLRSRLRRTVHAIFEKVDLIALPVTSTPPIARVDFDPFALTDPGRSAPSEVFNLAACPAISVPCGFSGNGLPVGLQLAARPLDEPTLLRAAYTYQQHNRLYERHPPEG